jgi:protein-S-isoprenylcysteine O-methyltransferase Ste14
MIFKIASLLGFALALFGIFFLLQKGYIISKNPVSIVLQVSAVALMIWARLTFGMRSFHAVANSTKGPLVTHGPYRWFRHPIYAAIIYFFIASLIAYPVRDTVIGFGCIFFGLLARMIFEEKFLVETYGEEYEAYMDRTKRIIPFIF